MTKADKYMMVRIDPDPDLCMYVDNSKIKKIYKMMKGKYDAHEEHYDQIRRTYVITYIKTDGLVTRFELTASSGKWLFGR